MADSEVATKAPESDAIPQPAVPEETRATDGPGMGEHCVTDRPAPAGEVPTGELSKLGGIDVYVSKPSDYPHAPSKLLLLLTGGTGIKSINNQLQADKYAAEGFLVVMPDQFDGDPAPNTATDLPQSDPTSTFIEHFKAQAATTVKSFLLDMWLARHTPEKVVPLLHKVIEAAKEEFADAVANGGGVYAVGYCFGAKYVLILAGEQQDPAETQAPKDEEQGVTPKAPLIKVGAIAHGTLVTKEDIEGVRVPMSMACVENDSLFPEEVLEAGRKALATNKVENEIQVYKKVPHGFAVLGDYEDRSIKEAQKQAFGQMLGWLQAH